MKFVITFFLALFTIQNSHAIVFIPPSDSCQDGTDWIGTFKFSTSVIEYCGRSIPWAIALGSTSPGSCPAGKVGSIRYSSGDVQFCNGTDWKSLDTCTTDTACTKAGAMMTAFSTGVAHYCDGSFWHTLSPSNCQATVACNDLLTSRDCGDKGGCHWTGLYCATAGDCAAYHEPAGCASDPVCSWYSGSCGGGI